MTVVAAIVIVVVVADAVVSVLVDITALAIVVATAALADRQQTVQSESLLRTPHSGGKTGMSREPGHVRRLNERHGARQWGGAGSQEPYVYS